MPEESCTKKAHAKINLGLDVLRRRPDGYHEVRMIMQTVALFDEVTVTRTAQPGVTLSCAVRGDLNAGSIPNDARNLAYRAAALLLDAHKPDGGVHIDLVKQIPAAAGMAGGSADAAAVLHAVNELFALRLSDAALASYGVKLGADIPYCVFGGTMLAEGIGERLTRLTPMPLCSVVLAKPDADISTKFVYENLHLDARTVHPDIDGMRRAITAQDLAGVAACMGNVLETVTEPVCPAVGKLKEILADCGALRALMSGSGPTVFGLFADAKDGEKACAAVRESGLAREVFLTEIV